MTRVATRGAALLGLVLAACSEPTTSEAGTGHAPARPAEGELATVHLEPASVEALGLGTARVQRVLDPRTRDVGGVVVVPPGQALSVTAPLAGTLRPGDGPLDPGATVISGQVLLRLVPFAPADRDVQAQAQQQRETTRARVELAKSRLERTRTLVEQRGASQRALEEAEADVATARAEDTAAAARVRMLRRSPMAADATLPIKAPTDGVLRVVSAAPGQQVAPGSSLFEIVDMNELWVRVPVYPGELPRLARDQPVRIARLGEDVALGTEVAPVLAPPSADSMGLSVDLFYAVTAEGLRLHPDERVVVRLPYAAESSATSVPASAVVLDFDGGSWIYECLGDTSFRRRRVEITRQDEVRAILRRGPAEGTLIVAVGTLELFGAELGVSH